MGEYLKTGIDVSSHQLVIEWDKVKPQVDFAMLRAGIGNYYDTYINENAKGCEDNTIPYGLYWFSYAFDEEEGRNEAKLLCDKADKLKPSYPLCFDLEYECIQRMYDHRITPTKDRLCSIAKAFMNEVEKRGYYAMFYTSRNMLEQYYSELIDRYDLWLACWNTNKPSVNCGIWQFKNTGNIEGIKTLVDLNYAYKDYENLIKGNVNSDVNVKKLTEEIANQIFDEFDKIKAEMLMERVVKILDKYVK